MNYKSQSIDLTSRAMGIAIAKSEYKRIKIFIIALIIGLVSMCISFFFINGTTTFFKYQYTKYYVIGWFIIFLIYEIIGYFTAASLLRRKVMTPWFLKMGSVIIESALPGVLLFILCYQEQSVIFLDSPLLFFYFILIALSSLNLEVKLSLLVGIVSAGSYLFVTIWAINQYDPNNLILDFPPELYYVRSFFMMLAALGATFVAFEIKKRSQAVFNLKKEKDEISRLFDQQVSKEVVDILLHDDFSTRRGHVSILFLDIRKYSSFAESRSPEEVIGFQNHFFGPILRIIEEYHGITNQILGDGIMATFGAPIPTEDHAQKAYEAAIAISTKVKNSISMGKIPTTKIGIGIHTGEVVMGNIGNELRKQFSISGTAVVLAARIEQANKEYNTEILISSSTRESISDKNGQIQSIGKINMENISKEIEVYRVDHE